jgi:hypothetical protein
LWGSDFIGVRRLEALVNSLPRDSATVRALDPDFAGTGWNTQTELLATIAELIDQHSRLYIMANSKKGAQTPRPIKIPRPGKIEIKKPELSSLEAMNRMWASGVQVYKEEAAT